MKFPLALFFMAALDVVGQTERFYLGTYTDNGLSKGIYTGTLDAQTGRLGAIELAATAKSPTFLALSPDGKNLYAVTANGKGTLATFHTEADGKLTRLNELTTSNVCCHVSVDATGENIFVASCGGGDVEAFQTKADGSLDRQIWTYQYTGSGPNPLRQTKPYAHSIYTYAANRFVYSCDLGTDHIWIFNRIRFSSDPSHDLFAPVARPSATVPPGSGPRHLAFSNDGKFVYVNGEMGLNVTTFARNPDTGMLAGLQTIPTLSPDVDTNDMTSAEIFVHPSGKWLYVSNRDVAQPSRGRDSIAVYAIGVDGMLTWRQNFIVPVQVPRGFHIDPTGQWLIVGGQSDNKIAVLKIDAATGNLSDTSQTATVGAPVCVVFRR
jgi:6-phosphogluconolactonase